CIAETEANSTRNVDCSKDEEGIARIIDWGSSQTVPGGYRCILARHTRCFVRAIDIVRRKPFERAVLESDAPGLGWLSGAVGHMGFENQFPVVDMKARHLLQHPVDPRQKEQFIRAGNSLRLLAGAACPLRRGAQRNARRPRTGDESDSGKND